MLFYCGGIFIIAIMNPIIKDTAPTNIQLKLTTEIVIEKTQSKPATIVEKQ